MYLKFQFSIYVVLVLLFYIPISGFSQELENVPSAFEAIAQEAELILVTNELPVPTVNGHLQGIQLIEKDGLEKLLLSGSSLTESYILQVDLKSRKTDRLIPLMHSPFRHAGGIQVSQPYLAVGIEDNFVKTTSKVCLYNYRGDRFYNSEVNLLIDRKGSPKDYTAGTSGILKLKNNYLILVSNWDSRNWDFYSVDPEENEQQFLYRFTAPKDWGSYQSINLLRDKDHIYAIGTYQKQNQGIADLFLISKVGTFEPIMERIDSRSFHTTHNVDFSTAAGIEVDSKGKLHIWATQRNATEQIAINRFSER